MAEQWLQLDDGQITTDDVHHLLTQVNDDHWVTLACVERVVNDSNVQRALLDLGISRSECVVERCTKLISLSSTLEQKRHTDILISHFEYEPSDAQGCNLRAVLLRRLDRLNSYVEMQKTFSKKSAMNVDEEMGEWEDDPWADSNAEHDVDRRNPSESYLLVSLSDFLRNDLLHSACEIAATEAVDAIRILLRRHTTALWPARFIILQCIPEYTEPSLCRHLFPSLDNSTNVEVVPVQDSWRQEVDFVELPETQAALRKLDEVSLIQFHDSAKAIPVMPVPDSLTAMELSIWYKNRAEAVILSTGMIDVALSIVQHGAAQGLPSLDELGEDLSLLSRLVYDAPQGKDATEDWTLSSWRSMQPDDIVKAYLAHSTPETLARDIWRLVMPYLYVLEARAERSGNIDPSLLTRILYNFIMTTSLCNAAAIFEASKPTLPIAQRIIKNDEDMARLALACLYGSSSLDEWATMSSIFECLPAWEIASDRDDDAAATTMVSLGAFVTPSTNRPPATPKDLFVILHPLSFASLSQALDILDVHLESGEILSRWNVPAPLRLFLQSSGNVNEQRAWANRMVRHATKKGDQLVSIEIWEWLLKDMFKLTGSGDPAARGAFCLLSREEVTTIFLSGLLSSGNFTIAKSMLYGPHSKIFLSPEEIETVSLACSRELYDNASSGNYKTGDMKLAYECLEVPKLSSVLVREKEFIEATSRITSFNILSSPGTPMSPIEIRLTKDRLSLISRVLSSNSEAYKHAEVMLDLCHKLGYRDDPVAVLKVLAMLADTALQAEDFTCAYENTERMIAMVSSLDTTRADIHASEVREVADVCWVSCFQLGRQPEFRNLGKKMSLLGHALEHCPADKIHDVLAAWKKLEVEDIHSREGKQRESDERANLPPRKVSVPSNVASTLRARLQDLHMPSPPLLSTPDAAALASRTFRSVAANFPFSVGHRPRSDIDERGSVSEETRRSEVEDVSSQASRVLSKGIGWLIGADGEI